MQLCTVPEDNRSHPKEVTVYVQKISISLPRKVSILRPPSFHSGNSNKTSYISLDFFFNHWLQNPQSLLWGQYVCFLELHIRICTNIVQTKISTNVAQTKTGISRGMGLSR